MTKMLGLAALFSIFLAGSAWAGIAECDALASHPADPDKVLPGSTRPSIDLPVAIEVCRAALDEVPNHARTNYHLGRVLFYVGKTDEAMPYIRKATDLGYRQAIFVHGYVLSVGEALPQDFCAAGELWLRGIALDHPWSSYHLVEKSLDNNFKDCDFDISDADLARYMDFARSTITVKASDGRVEALYDRYKTEKNIETE